MREHYAQFHNYNLPNDHDRKLDAWICTGRILVVSNNKVSLKNNNIEIILKC